jgi:hypothetical protein
VLVHEKLQASFLESADHDHVAGLFSPRKGKLLTIARVSKAKDLICPKVRDLFWLSSVQRLALPFLESRNEIDFPVFLLRVSL